MFHLIRQRLSIAQDIHSAYIDQRHRDINFTPKKCIFLEVSPTKGGMRFGRRSKLTPRYIDPFKMLRQVGEVAYKLMLPISLSIVHPLFHVSMLKKYVSDGLHKLQHEEVDIRLNLSYEEEVMWILHQSLKTLCKKEVPLVKLLCSCLEVEEATWEREDEMWWHFPRFFQMGDRDLKY